MPFFVLKTALSRLAFVAVAVTAWSLVFLAPTHAHLIINLKVAESEARAGLDASDIVRQFTTIADAGKLKAVIAALPKHVRRFPGMLIIKAGSNWSTATIVFPDGRQTRILHLGLVPAIVPSEEALAMTSGVYSGSASVAVSTTAAMLLTPPEVGDPFKDVLARSFSEDDNWQTPTLVELRMPLNGQALFDVLNARARLELPKGSSAGIECNIDGGRGCTPRRIIAPLIAAAYGLETFQTAFESASPLTYTLDLARRFGADSFKLDNNTGCRPVYPEIVTGRGQDVLWRSHVTSWALWSMALGELEDSDQLTDASVIDLMRTKPDLIEFALGGVFDPAGLWAIDCTMRREIIHGESHGAPNIPLRSRYYDRAGKLIGDTTDAIEGRGRNEIIFFDAASHVTRGLAVGMSDVLEIYETTGTLGEFVANGGLRQAVMDSGGVSGRVLNAHLAIEAGELLARWGFSGLTDDADFEDIGVPDARQRAFLRDLNLLLYVNNRQMLRNMYRALTAHDDESSGLGLPDPINTPVGRRISEGFWFDLRMVLFEQGLIEQALPDSRQQDGYHAMIDSLDGIARVGTALVSGGQPHRAAWIDRVVYGAARDVIKSERLNAFSHFLPPKPVTQGPRAMMEPTFDNYWYRVTLGSTFVLLLHAMEDPLRLSKLCSDKGVAETDRVRCNAAVEAMIAAETARRSAAQLDFSHSNTPPPQVAPLAQLAEIYMFKRITQAPRDAKAPTAEELNTLDSARVGDFVGTQDALATTLGALLSTGEPRQVYRCTSVADGVKAVGLKFGETTTVFKALTDVRGQHWRTLPDLFDILVGGATSAPPLLGEGGTADDEVCKGIEARFAAAEALAAGQPRPLGEGTSGVRIPLNGAKPAFVAFNDPDATLFRSNSRRLWLHLQHHLCRGPLDCIPDENAAQIARQTIALADETARWRAKLKVLAAVEASGAPAGLGFDPQTMPSVLLERLDGPPMSLNADIDAGQPGAPSDDMLQLSELMQMPVRLQRLADARDDVETYFNTRTKTGKTPFPYPVTPMVDDGGDPASVVDNRPVTPKFVVETTPSGSVTVDNGAKIETYSGELFFQIPMPRTQLGAAANGGDRAPASIDFSDAPPSVLDIPFGLTIEGLARAEDGSLYLTRRNGINSLLGSPGQTKSALSATGVPELFDAGTHRILVRLNTDDPLDGFSLILRSEPKVFGVDLQRFEVALWDDGTSIEDFPARLLAAYRKSVTDTFERATNQELQDVLSVFAFTLDLSDGKTLTLAPNLEATCVRLGQSKGCEVDDLEPGGGLELSVHAGYTLSLRAGGQQVAAVSPRLDLIWTGQGVSIQSADVVGELTQEALRLFNDTLNEAVRPLWEGQETLRDMSINLKRGADQDWAFQLEVRGSIDAGIDCPAPMTVVLDLEKDLSLKSLIDAALDDAVEAATAAAVACAAKQSMQLSGADFQTSFQIGAEELTVALIDPARLNDAVLPIELSYSALPGTMARGLEFNVANQTLDLSDGRSTEDKEALNAIVEAAAIKQVNAFIGASVSLRNISIEKRTGGGIAAFGDLVLSDVPYLGDVTLPRIDLAHPNEANLQAALTAAMRTEAVALLDKALPNVLELPFVGRFTRTQDGISIELGATKELKIKGDLAVFDDVTAPTTIVVNLESRAVDVKIDETGTLNSALSTLGPLQDGLGFGPIKVENIRFDRVPSQPRRYAVFFDVDVEIVGLFSVAAENLMLSESGLRLGPVIGGSIPFPVETGVVSLSSIGFKFYTGEGGGKSGIVLDTDITAFNAAVASLAKIEASLDLRDIGNLRFRMDGDLIVLESFPLMYSRGDVALNDLSFDFEAGTVPQIEDIISARGSASLKGKDDPPKFTSQTALSILRVKLSEDELKLVLPIGTTGSIDYTSFTNLLIAKGNLQLSSPLDFSDPRLGGGLDLDLFGWSPGGVGINLDLRRAHADIRALFLEAGITVAHADLFDPQVIIDMLLSLFDINLEDLLEIELDDIEIKLGKIGSDGSTGPDGDQGDDGPPQSSQSAGDEGNDDGVPPGKAGTDDGTEDEPAPENTNPANEGGDVFATRYCEHVYTDANGVKRFEFWLRENPNITGDHIYRGHQHDSEQKAASWHNLTFREGTRPINMCVDGSGGPRRAGTIWTTILTKRTFEGRPTECHHPSKTPEPPVVDGWSARDEKAAEAAGHEARLVHAKSPFMCWVADGRVVFTWAQILVNSNNGVETLIFCPGITRVPHQVRKDKLFNEVCGKEAPMSRPGRAVDGDFKIEKRDQGDVRIITAAAEARIVDEIRTAIVTGQTLAPIIPYDFDDLSLHVETRPLWGSEPERGLRVVFTHTNSGKRRTMFLWDGALSRLIYQDVKPSLAQAVLRHWYKRHVLSKRPWSERAPRFVSTPEDTPRQSYNVVTYARSPGLDDMLWFPDNVADAEPARVRWSSGTPVGIAPDGPAWPRLLVLISQLLAESPADFPTELQLTLGPHSEFYKRSFLLFEPADHVDDDPVMLAGLLYGKRPRGDGPVGFSATDQPTALVETTRSKLACQITQAHKRSLKNFTDDLKFSAAALPDVILNPDQARQKYELAHDAVTALFETMENCP